VAATPDYSGDSRSGVQLAAKPETGRLLKAERPDLSLNAKSNRAILAYGRSAKIRERIAAW